MKLENQVTSLETSKELQNIGVPQYSLFGWTQHFTHKSGEFKKDSKPYLRYKGSFDYSAFTVSELADMIPMTYFLIEQHSNDYRVGIQGKSGFMSAPTMVEALAQLVIKIYSK